MIFCIFSSIYTITLSVSKIDEEEFCEKLVCFSSISDIMMRLNDHTYGDSKIVDCRHPNPQNVTQGQDEEETTTSKCHYFSFSTLQMLNAEH